MIQTANRQAMSIVGWILAAVVLLGINGIKLTSMRNSLYGRHSTEIMAAKEKSNQLEEIFEKLKEEEIKYGERLGKILSFGTKSTIHSNRVVPASKGKEEAKKKVEIKPPQLSGVMQVSDINGVVESSAVIEGKRYREKARVKGFKISNITAKGVWFTKSGGRWFVPIPDVPFSVKYHEQKKISTPSEESSETADLELMKSKILNELPVNSNNENKGQ